MIVMLKNITKLFEKKITHYRTSKFLAKAQIALYIVKEKKINENFLN